MNDSEDEIKRQSHVQQVVVQGLGRPRGEQPEDREAGDGLGGGNFVIQQDENGDDQVNQENEAEHQPRPLRERRKAQEPGGEDQGNGHQSKSGTGKPLVCRTAKFCGPGRPEIQHVEPEQDGQRDQDFVAFKIFFRLEKLSRPADLHERGPGGSQRGQEIPAAVQRHHDEAGVENGDVAEQTQRIVLAGGKQDGGEETAQHAENGHNEGLQPVGEQKSRCRDEHHQQKCRERSKEWELIVSAARESNGIKNDHSGGAQRL